MKNITIQDIADKAGVSKATVSRVLNTPEKVEEVTRGKVEQIMRATNYTPSATARNLSNQASSTIGVIVPEIGNAFFGELFKGIEEIISKNKLSLLYSSNEDDGERDFQALEMMRAQRVQGVLYVPALNYPAVRMTGKLQKKLDSMPCPIVCIDRDIHLNLDTIHFDDRTAVREAVVALQSQGHQRIAFLNGNAKKNILAEERYQGYLDGVLQADETLIFQGEYQESYAYQATKTLLSYDFPPTAVITCNNSLGRGYLQAVYEEGRPEAFTHISLDQIEMLDILKIPHNYVYRDAYTMGKRAAELLIRRIAFPGNQVENITMNPKLVLETF